MRNLFSILQIVVCASLVGLIVLQAKGTGLGNSSFLSGELYSSKRGIEKVIFILTIVLAVVFAAISLWMLVS